MSTPQMYDELYQHVQTWAGILGAQDGDDIIYHIYKRLSAGIKEAIEKGVPEQIVKAILTLGDHARQLEREAADLRGQLAEARKNEARSEQEPCAWRYRYGKTGMWRYADTAENCNPSPEYEREPLYSHPWAALAKDADK